MSKFGHQNNNKIWLHIGVTLAAIAVVAAVCILLVLGTEPKQAEPFPSAPEESAPVSRPAEPAESSDEEPDPEETAIVPVGFGIDAPWYEPEFPMLINREHPIPDDFVPDVADVGNGYSFDAQKAPALLAMIDAAKADEISLWPVSAYRSREAQEQNYNNKIAEYEGLGYTHEEAVIQTSKYIASPGASEHSVGLAVDLNSLEESFEQTDAFRWLQEHCAEYGFVMRYPKDKTDITQINFEPWHYRYVGSNHAKYMMENELCLEEYMARMGQ